MADGDNYVAVYSYDTDSEAELAMADTGADLRRDDRRSEAWTRNRRPEAYFGGEFKQSVGE